MLHHIHIHSFVTLNTLDFEHQTFQQSQTLLPPGYFKTICPFFGLCDGCCEIEAYKTVMYCATHPVPLVQNVCGVGVERNKLVEILNLYWGAPVSAWLR